jgi:hypothetical protein
MDLFEQLTPPKRKPAAKRPRVKRTLTAKEKAALDAEADKHKGTPGYPVIRAFIEVTKTGPIRIKRLEP